MEIRWLFMGLLLSLCAILIMSVGHVFGWNVYRLIMYTNFIWYMIGVFCIGCIFAIIYYKKFTKFLERKIKIKIWIE